MKINSRRQFEYALHAGHGSVQLYVQQHGLDKVADLVLNACLQNHSYDCQCEEEREKWLADLFFDTAYYPEFFQKIIAAFQTITDDQYYDAIQIYKLLCELAKRGNTDAYVAVQAKIETQIAQYDISVDYAAAWLELAGLNALPKIAESIGFRLLNIDDSWSYPLETLLPSQLKVSEARIFLQPKALENSLIQAYLAHDEKETNEQAERVRKRQIISAEERIRSSYSLEQLLNDSNYSNLTRLQQRNIRVFGEFSTLEERAIILSRLEQVTDKHELINLLLAFHQAELPVLSSKIWELARTQDCAIRAKALTALSNSKHLEIYQFALKQIENTQYLFETPQLLELFKLNFHQGDEYRILNAIKSFVPKVDSDSKDQAEVLGRIFNSIAEKQLIPDVITLLYWTYENSPCSICRYTNLELLKMLNGITAEIHQECLYDAYSETRELAQSRQEVGLSFL